MTGKRFLFSFELPFASGTAAILFGTLVVVPITLLCVLGLNLLSSFWIQQIFHNNEVTEHVEYFYGINQTGYQCDSRQFECKRFEGRNVSALIPYSQRCNGHPDCMGAEDEKHCMYCQTNFQCKSATDDGFICLRPNKLCDGIADCPNGEDELQSNCGRPIQKNTHLQYDECGPGEFSCFYKCIPEELVCNGEVDCPLGEGIGYDEHDCSSCKGKSKWCKGGQMYAKSSGKCVPEWQICDGNMNCFDHSDEQYFHCKSMDNCPGACHADQEDIGYKEYYKASHLTSSFEVFMGDEKKRNKDQILCRDGEWRHMLYACSGQFPQCDHACHDCKLGSFHCVVENKCMNASVVCNNVEDCLDGSDELNCNNETIQCDYWERRCNGIVDCEDARDELNCTTCRMTKQLADMFDSDKDKFDEISEFININSDLFQNNVYSNWYLSTHKAFHCVKDKKCVPIWSRCDGVPDCSDGADEEKCSCMECLMHPERMYICQQGDRCFKWGDVCDGQQTKCPNPSQLDIDYCINGTSFGF